MIENKGVAVKKFVRLYIAEVEEVGQPMDAEEVAFTQWFPVNRDTALLLTYEQNINFFIENVLPKI
jgi:hypothetical protein